MNYIFLFGDMFFYILFVCIKQQALKLSIHVNCTSIIVNELYICCSVRLILLRSRFLDT